MGKKGEERIGKDRKGDEGVEKIKNKKVFLVVL